MEAADPQGPQGRWSAGPPIQPSRADVKAGAAIQFFYQVPLHDLSARYVSVQSESSHNGKGNGYPSPANGKRPPWPLLLQSHGWFDGTLEAGVTLESVAASYVAENQATWPTVRPSPHVMFVDRNGRPSTVPKSLETMKVPLERLRAPTEEPPTLSMIMVRWGGEDRVGDGCQTEGEGDWGKFGCPPCDWYMEALVQLGVLRHPKLAPASAHRTMQQLCPVDADAMDLEAVPSYEFELFSLFVRNSPDAARITHIAPDLARTMKGAKKASFWMLWPAEWEDFGGKDYAGYVETKSMFSAMRACEAQGIRSSFPHPANQYELITSKKWMASLVGLPGALMPAAVMVSKDAVAADSQAAARQTIAEIEQLRQRYPFPNSNPDVPAPSVINKDGMRKGVAKLGWSWEARFVTFFTGEVQLAKALREMLFEQGYLGKECVVQEWVDFDFEMRLYMLPNSDWTSSERVLPRKIEFNCWGQPSKNTPGSFHKLSREKAIQRWQQDELAIADAEEKGIAAAQVLLAWLSEKEPQPVAMIRLDFMLLRTGPGQARVTFGEFCEMGACCLAWQEGPPQIWRAALDYALR